MEGKLKICHKLIRSISRFAVVGILILTTSMRILKEYERAVIFRLGRFVGTRGPGLVFMIPFWIERMQRVSLRVLVNDVTPQDVITKDNVFCKRQRCANVQGNRTG